MSFTGDLEHLSIVDVIQLLHATRKSGTLSVKGRRGESQLVFDDGYIISANHCDTSARIGTILVEAGVISAEILERALQEQRNAGENRKPLVATLIEKERVRKEDAYRGLETLIELTIVEILTWKRGTFALDVGKVSLSDEYRYFPETLNQDMHLHTENVLMDALRIYDEKKRDGLLMEDLTDEEPFEEEALPADGGRVLSAEDLGLADLDLLEKTIPKVFAGLEERSPVMLHRRKIEELAPALSEPELEELLSFFGEHGRAPAEHGAPGLSVILYSADEFMSYCLTAVCKQSGISVFASNEEQDLDPIIGQFLAKGSMPVLVLDAPVEADPRFSAERIAALRRQKMEKFPQLCTLQLASPDDYRFTLQCLGEGVRAVLPRPPAGERQESFIDDTRRFLEAFPAYLHAYGREQAGASVAQLRETLLALRQLQETLLALRQLREPQEVAFALLKSVAAVFERSLTLIVRETELIAERGIGVGDDKGRGATAPLRFRIPLAQPSLFREAIEKGTAFFGKSDDEIVREHLFAAIDAPLHPTVLLLPLRSFGKTISLTYGDFGRREPSSVRVDLLETLADQAGIVVENALYRRKRERTP